RGVVSGIHNYVRKHSPWQIFVEPHSERENIRVPEGWKGEGIIARVQSSSMAKVLERKGIPIVNVSGIRLKKSSFHQVTTDLEAAVRIAVEHFLDRGFRNFGYFSLLGLSYVSDQQNAYIRHLKELEFSCAMYTSRAGRGAIADWTLNMDSLAAWLRSLPKPVAIFTWNASSGRQLVHGCQWAGLHVPEDVAVLSGADDDLFCEVSHVPVSGIAAATEAIGHEAAVLLDQLMKRRRPSHSPKLIAPLGVIARQSTDTLAIREKPLADAVRFIRDHANQPIQVQDILDQVPLSRSVLERLFVRVLQRTPAEEIRRVHFERAKHLLEQTDIPEPEVAEASGFGSPEYMVYIFTRQLGVSPIQYRKKVRSR
ncbi:MAG TPA: helix-turn-helix domain-containing protein, partial [Verrucomicrobia bacterium]|nr:helix-turn-helix domain-containing protein [Verrucomicrobiota bacterium]